MRGTVGPAAVCSRLNNNDPLQNMPVGMDSFEDDGQGGASNQQLLYCFMVLPNILANSSAREIVSSCRGTCSLCVREGAIYCESRDGDSHAAVYL